MDEERLSDLVKLVGPKLAISLEGHVARQDPPGAGSELQTGGRRGPSGLQGGSLGFYIYRAMLENRCSQSAERNTQLASRAILTAEWGTLLALCFACDSLSWQSIEPLIRPAAQTARQNCTLRRCSSLDLLQDFCECTWLRFP